jgi:DNA polymerase-3 subunit gamma/tau
VLGQALLEMRHAPDPRLLVEVALVKLTHTDVDPGMSSLLARIKHLEDQRAQGITLAAAPEPKPPVDPITGRAKLGSRAGDATGPVARPTPTPTPPPTSPPIATPVAAAPASPETGSVDVERLTRVWSGEVLTQLKPLVRALYAAGTVMGERDGALAISLPNEPHRDRAEQHRSEVEAAVAKVAGRSIRLSLVIEANVRSGRDSTGGQARPAVPSGGASAVEVADEAAEHLGDIHDVRSLPDVPKGAVDTPIDRLTQAFPGAELIDDD